MNTQERLKVRFVVTVQGWPTLNSGHVVACGENIAAIQIDLKTKGCSVACECVGEDMIPEIWIMPNRHDVSEDCITQVAFPDYKGWKVFCSDLSRYTLQICLVRDPETLIS